MKDTEIKTASGDEYGRSLDGFGFNLLVRDVKKCCAFLTNIFDMKVIRADKNFAVVKYGNEHFMLHQDGTYADNPFLSLLPEAGPRGVGIELRLYHSDPDICLERASKQTENLGCTILRECSNRPHGLRECYILDENGYCFVPSKPITN